MFDCASPVSVAEAQTQPYQVEPKPHRKVQSLFRRLNSYRWIRVKLTQNTVYNLLGLGVPLLAAVPAIPLLIGALGTDRFGLLALMWAIVNYLSLFDLGLGRALTQRLAAIRGQDGQDSPAALVLNALTLLGAMGSLAGLMLLALAYWGRQQFPTVTGPGEFMGAAYALAAAMPAITITSGLRGVLEAEHAFATVNLLRLPMGLFGFLGPLAVALVYPDRLDLLAWILAAGRFLTMMAHACCIWLQSSVPLRRAQLDLTLMSRLIRAGGWLSFSNLISAVLGYVDRFIIGAIVSPTAISHYAVPHELVTKLWVMPTALTSAMYPAIAEASDPGRRVMGRLLTRAILGILVVMLPICGAGITWAYPLLEWWINAEFARHSSVPLQILLAGMLLSSLAMVPFTYLQGRALFRLTAAIHAVELPVFMVAIYIMTRQFGVTGAAMAWTLRAAADGALMYFFCRRALARTPAEPASLAVSL